MPRQDRPDGSQRPSRRMVLRSAAGAGAAGVAATALSGLGGAAHAAEARTNREDRNDNAHAVDPADNSDQFVVHVRDARTGQIDVFRGNGQIRLHDRDLARLLDRLSRR
jgi:nitrous oxide reductase